MKKIIVLILCFTLHSGLILSGQGSTAKKRQAARARSRKPINARDAAQRKAVAVQAQRRMQQQKAGAGKQVGARPTIVARGEAQTGNFVFFWQIPDAILSGKSKVVDKSCLSQWYPAEFRVYNITFYNAEQFMMYCKARLFKDYRSATEILETKNPRAIKKAGKEIQGYDDRRWSRIAPLVVEIGNIEKFRQNPALKRYLVNTGNKILAEASPYDKVWGIGLAETDPEAKNQTQWQGQNKLGKALMAVRNKFKKTDYPYRNLIEKSGQFQNLLINIAEHVEAQSIETLPK